MDYENGLFIFRRDLRIVDNNGLNLINSCCKKAYTIFIFTPEQVTSKNKFKSDNAVQFMIESLKDLAHTISQNGGHLYTFYGSNDSVIADCIKTWDINVVCYNIDYSPYARERDAGIVKLCEKMKTYVMYSYDYYLLEPEMVVNGSGDTYQKFTPFYQAALKKKVDEPAKMRKMNLSSSSKNPGHNITLENALKKFVGKVNPDILVNGGRIEAIKALKSALKSQAHYHKTHNDLANPTSQLSAYLKFGCVSIREAYKAFRSIKDLIRQLFWRDFYANILLAYPRVLGHALKPNYEKIRWHNNDRWFQAWTKGETGFPVVDAGMRQMNATGYMHNRARLIVASFLIKTLLISWEKGEQYFASKLTDYDPASNNGNWQWTASTGADSQPFFRIFNPMEQGKNYDPECVYIKTWVPELKDVPVKDILHWDTEWLKHKDAGYFKPICDYKEQKELALKMYKSIF
uniref:Photolyase/cryptochrome alpha/beta domain-containing protein n=1 Tax=viral metagenome TaxID=1070528 RepID=A0A6C0IJI6_9ZZZZ